MPSQKHILVADDEADTLQMMKFILSSKDYKVSTAENGEKALKMLCASEDYDMLVTDVQMPGMKGDELIEEMRKRDITIPVIAITGYGEKKIVVELLQKGCDDYIDKPIKVEDLVTRIERLFLKQDAKEEQLVQTQKMAEVGTFAGEIAHDLNNMLGVAMGFSDLAQEKLSEDSPVSWDLSKIHKASHRAATLSRQLLSFSRKQQQNMVVLDINERITDILSILSSVVGKRIEIELNLSRDPWIMNAVEGDVDQILMNLVVNARDAMPNGGRLVIKTMQKTLTSKIIKDKPHARPGTFFCLTISDSGSGMSKGTMQKIFKPFYTTKKKGKGTGLGLATVYRIAKEYKGWVEVESLLNRGTTFRVYIPVSSDEIVEETDKISEAEKVS